MQVTEVLADLGKVRGLEVASVYGGVPIPAQAAKAKKAHVLVATPGRLQDLMDRRLVNLDAVTILVLDEADRMLDMGFKPQVDKILRRVSDDRQTMFFSATLDGAVGELARAYTNQPVRIEAELPSEHKPGEIDHQFVSVTPENKVEKLVELLEAERGLALVFVRTKRGADRLAQRLERHQVRAVAMHGDKTQAAREKALAHFEAGKVTTLIATDVAARGLDLSDITHVINFDPPEDEKAYTHRVGRTGRAGRSGTGVTLVLPDQQAEVSRVARLNGQHDKWEETGHEGRRPEARLLGPQARLQVGPHPASPQDLARTAAKPLHAHGERLQPLLRVPPFAPHPGGRRKPVARTRFQRARPQSAVDGLARPLAPRPPRRRRRPRASAASSSAAAPPAPSPARPSDRRPSADPSPHCVLQLAHARAEPARHRPAPLGAEEEHEHAGQDEDLPDSEAERHAEDCSGQRSRTARTRPVRGGGRESGVVPLVLLGVGLARTPSNARSNASPPPR